MSKPKLGKSPYLSEFAVPGAVVQVKVTPKTAQDRVTFDSR